jgi:DNA replication protein DnaC
MRGTQSQPKSRRGSTPAGSHRSGPAGREGQSLCNWRDTVERLAARTPDPEPPGLAAERSARLRHDLFTRGVMKRYLDIDLTHLSPDLPDGYHRLAKRLLALLQKPELIAVGGPRRRGKTALASGLMRAFLESDRDLHAWYTTAQKLFTDLRNEPWERKGKIWDRYRRCHLLVVDEVQDREAAKFSAEEAVFQDLIDVRYGDGLATLLVTNLEPDPLTRNLGEKLQGRLDEEGGFYLTNWPRIRELLGDDEREE